MTSRLLRQLALPALASVAACDLAAAASGRPPRRVAASTQASAGTRPAPRDALDSVVLARMAQRRIPGVSLAVVRGGRIVDVRAYGTTEAGGGTPVTPATRFQAASISKPVSALGVLRLVQEGRLALDEDVNRTLRSWKVPENELTRREPVTLRRLLSHTAGINLRGIPGMPTSAELPSLAGAMSGAGNTPALEVTLLPGSAYRYSGGGYAIAQQLVEDASGEAFAAYMQRAVLGPLGMAHSTFEVPLPASLAAAAATGHTLGRAPIVGRWHDIREVAAAGLWTTPTDLARWVVGVVDALGGRSPVLSADMARRMLTVEQGNYALGYSVDGRGAAARFYHGGQNHGFESYVTGVPATGDGAVVMINTNDGGSFIAAVMDHLARANAWPSYPVWTPERVARSAIAPALLRAVTGQYAFAPGQPLSFRADGGRLLAYRNALPDEEFVPARDGRLVSVDRAVAFRAVRDSAGRVVALDWTERGAVRRVPRVGAAGAER